MDVLPTKTPKRNCTERPKRILARRRGEMGEVTPPTLPGTAGWCSNDGALLAIVGP